jgi:rubredoxin
VIIFLIGPKKPVYYFNDITRIYKLPIFFMFMKLGRGAFARYGAFGVLLIVFIIIAVILWSPEVKKSSADLTPPPNYNIFDCWQCTIDGYVYDPWVGDPDNSYPPGTSFYDLPTNCACPYDGSPKNSIEHLNDCSPFRGEVSCPTCSSLSKPCGTYHVTELTNCPDLDCGNCSSGQYCNNPTAANSDCQNCLTCQTLNKQCGTWPASPPGCEALSCGLCPENQYCANPLFSDSYCTSCPTCQSLNKECGTFPSINPVCSSVSCGSGPNHGCVSGKYCAEAETSNSMCMTCPTCESAGHECGTLYRDADCGGNLQCGSGPNNGCPTGKHCVTDTIYPYCYND